MVDRRSFFNPRRLLKQVNDLQTDLESSLTQLEKLGSAPVVLMQRDAMACQFEIQFGVRHPDKKLGLAAFDLIESLESQLTVYNDRSEVSRLNDRAALMPVTVEERLFELLTFCQTMGRETEGAFDITAGPFVRTWGFKRRQGRLPDDEEIQRVLNTVGYQKVQLEPTQKSVQFDIPGMEINFGGVGKGYALDRVAERFGPEGLDSVLMSAGHSSLLAKGKPYWDTAWQIDVLHPLEPGVRVAMVRLTDQGFSTSGISEQYFWHQGKRYSHIIDPRTGWPVQGTLQVSVVAPTAALAEVLSTAFFVNGLAWSMAYCRRHPEVGALYIVDPGPTLPVQVKVLGNIAARVETATIH